MSSASVQHIAKSFGPVHAVRDVTFEIEPGEIFGMLGPNGAGKTTTIRIMLDIFKADSGTVEIFGGPMSESKKNRIGYLPEDRGLYKDLKLERVLLYLASLKGLDETTAKERLYPALEQFDLYQHRMLKVQELSKGMQQKAQLIATMLHDPDLLILDEPFSGLDPINTRMVKALLEEKRAAGKTIVMSTHQMNQVEALCNRIVLIHQGNGLLYGQVNKIKERFSGNTVLVEGKGDFSAIPGVLHTRTENGRTYLTLESGLDPQILLQHMVNQPDLDLTHFQVESPSLDDIFVNVVQGKVSNYA
ncbi:MAG: ATP-binding cassette domain-containing protein [Anaerolineales bacterium]|nr:ATP-binding cassette domain-containing protein [Anaerolineales bacterium]